MLNELFSELTLIGVFERIVSAGIEFLEVGFLDQRRPYDPDRSIFPDTESVTCTFGGLDRGTTKLVAMIDFGTCDLSHIQPRSHSCLDGIRVIFKKHLREPAMAFCRQLKEMGYTVFSQLVSITSYTDEELTDLVRLVNDAKPYAVSIVDTYGLLHKGKLYHYYEMLERLVDKSVVIGYHSHNNFQLAYANCIELIEHHKDSGRTLLCDGSLFGMGKGAGNAPIELLCMYLRDNYARDYHLSQLLEAIDANILPLYNKFHWGYSLKAFVAASNDCHPNYVSYLIDKKTLSIKSVNDILSLLQGDKKLLYDREYIEQLYIDYQKQGCDDTDAYEGLREFLAERSLLILGPGKTILEERQKISEYISENKPCIISINYLPEGFDVDALFLTNSKRYNQQVSAITLRKSSIKLLATSNLTRTNGDFDFTFDYESLVDRDAVFMDNSFIMMLKILSKARVEKVAMAGFDGYSADRDNYYASKMEYDFTKKLGSEINAYVDRILPVLGQSMSLRFITTTVYKAL